MLPEPITTNAFYMDEKHDIGVLFGLNYVGISLGHGETCDGIDAQIIQFNELQEPFDFEHPENAKVREDVPSISLVFRNKESIETVIKNLQALRSKFLKGPAILDAKLEDQDFAIRTLNVLRCAELVTVRDLVRYKRTDLLKFRNFGKVSLRDIDEWLERHDLQWGMDV